MDNPSPYNYLEMPPALIVCHMVTCHVVEPGMQCIVPGLAVLEQLHLHSGGWG